MRRLVASLQSKHALLLFGAVCAALPIGGMPASLSVLCGGAIQTASLWTLERTVAGWVRRAQGGSPGAPHRLAWLRMPSILLIVGGALYLLDVEPGAFTLGLSVVVPAVIWHGLVPVRGEV